MKIKNGLIVAIFSISVLTSCSVRRYDHARVKIEAGKPEQTATLEENEAPLATSAFTATENTEKNSIQEENVLTANANTKTADIEKTPVKNTKMPAVKKQKAVSLKINKTITGIDYLSDKISKQEKLSKVQDVHKTALSGWLKWMIVCFVVGLVLVILGAIFAATIGGFVIWWLFYVIGALLITAGFILLILGLVGVI